MGNNMTMPQNFSLRDELLGLLQRFEHLGMIQFENGTISIGKLPRKKQWFLAHVFGPLQQADIDEIGARLHRTIPHGLCDMLRQFNGATLFGAGQIQIWGLRGPAPEDMPNYQPVSLVNANLEIYHRTENLPKGVVFFGTYFGRYRFAALPSQDRVTVVIEDSGRVIEEWPSVDAAIIDVTRRLAQWFRDDASAIDERVLREPVIFPGKPA